MDEHFEAVIPSWLEAPPTGKVNPPVETRSQELPFGELTWENFEKLCLRLAQLEANVEHCQLYGVRGQDQEGIDIYARQRLADKYRVYQCKRVKDFGSANIKDAVSKFLKGKWVSQTDTFVLCTQVSLNRTELADEIETQSKRLKNDGITFLPWGSDQLSITLKDHPKLVEDFFGRTWVAAFCGREQAGRLDRRPNAEVAERYSSWLRKTTTHFFVPGLGIGLPIETAWIQLQAYGRSETEERDRPKTIEEWLASYHEWSRLAARRENRSKAFDADYIAEFNRQIVVIGGPGAGKSTLLRRVAHRLAGLGKRVLLVRLPHVAKYCEQGKTFEEAILKVAADGSGIEIDQLQLILANPDYLLADGLDECDPQRATLANALFRWAAGHSHTRVVVTTRPVGHDAGLLPGWEYTELLPLDSQGNRKNAQQLIEARFADKTQLEEQLTLFEQRLETNRTASLAARNPLLLGFLVQLSINGVELVQHRAGLYESIIELVCNQSLPDRELKVELDASTAFRVIEIIGWILQDTPGIPKPKLLDLLGKELADELGIRSLAARIKAEEGLKFWEERRIIERLSIGHQNAVTFVHPSLGEYAAGRYASSLSEKELRQWLARVRREPKWRETILLSAGAGAAEQISTYLLELDNLEEPTSTESVLAAAALAETTEPPLELIEAVAHRLQQRLQSPIPSVVGEATEVALSLSQQAPDIIKSITQPLFEHSQLWTRYAAVQLSLVCGGDGINLDILEQLLDRIIAELVKTEPALNLVTTITDLANFSTTPTLESKRWYEKWEFQQNFILKAIELLIQKRPGAKTDKRIEQVLNGNISIVTSFSIFNLLESNGYESILKEINKKKTKKNPPIKSIIKSFSQPRELWQQREKKAHFTFLRAVLHAIDNHSIPSLASEELQELPMLGALLQGMGWRELRGGDASYAWQVMGEYDDLGAVDAVLRGMIAVMELDPSRLALEVSWALEHVSEFWSKIPQVTIKLKWELARDTSLPPEDLVNALKHPSIAFARSASLLLAHGAGGLESSELVREVLQGNNELVIKVIANAAPGIWGNEALEVVLDRVTKPITRHGCYHLLRAIPKLPGAENNQCAFVILLRALLVEDPVIAAGAARSLSEFETAAICDFTPWLRKALQFWTTHGESIEQRASSVYRKSKPNSHIVLPSPQVELVRVLANLGQLKFEELCKLCNNSLDGIQEIAIKALVSLIKKEPSLLANTIKNIEFEALPVDVVLTQILCLPKEVLCQEKSKLLALFDSPHINIRKELMQALVCADWLDREEAIILARKALQDDELAVRDQAVETLRILESQ